MGEAIQPLPDAASRLIAEYPLAWVVARTFEASLLPLIAERDETGAIVALFGHMAKRNPLVSALARDAGALVLFNGPSGYISPQLIDRPDWAPTWNYAALRCEVRVEFVPGETPGSLERLLDQMERSAPERWTVERMGPRYAKLLAHIVAFRAHVVRFDPRMKLGQDEAPPEFDAIVDRHPNRTLADWMAAVADRDDHA